MYRYLLTFALLFNICRAQNFAVSYLKMPTCYQVCDGKITFTTGAVTGPFTCTVTNNAGCPNPTLQTSGTNSITMDSICGCNGTYTFAIYNASMSLVGTMVQNIINYATAPLAVGQTSLVPATCSNCCDGSISFTVSGGNQMSPPSYSVDGSSTPSINPLYFQCVGNHTLCVEDASGCKVCLPFNMTYQGGPTYIKGNSVLKNIKIFPQPVIDELNISSEKEITAYSVIDATGRVVMQGEPIRAYGRTYIHTGELPAGIYTLRIQNFYGETGFFRFVRQAGD